MLALLCQLFKVIFLFRFVIETRQYILLLKYLTLFDCFMIANKSKFHRTAISFFMPSSLAKGCAHGPLSLHPWQIELDFVISADRHLAVFTGLAYKDDITFDQWVLLTVSCLGRCKMVAPSVYLFDCIHVMFS